MSALAVDGGGPTGGLTAFALFLSSSYTSTNVRHALNARLPSLKGIWLPRKTATGLCFVAWTTSRMLFSACRGRSKEGADQHVSSLDVISAGRLTTAPIRRAGTLMIRSNAGTKFSFSISCR